MTFAWTAVAVAALILATFAVALRRRRFDTIDSAWGLGFALVAAVTLAREGGVPTAVLTLVWGLRLAAHITWRNRRGGEDPRYARMRQEPGRIFVRVYLTQGVVLWVVSLPVQVAPHGSPPLWLTCLGVGVWLVGFVFEAVGDFQLQRFRADPASGGRVLDTGLWRYTRHPNYFGDACAWWGLYLLACHSWPAAATIVSPLIMTALLARGTGKPMLERDLVTRRPGYADYVRRTSGFLPLPPKRGPGTV
ncbi:DUF1295 domain-containing protein [Amycolatopsis endophytica]|uniref:Steroid 5-alpha reductase family enzyme n=1 Tax=Amycolatopsis endophytica TaxID=860233 RepID=A0A853B891_9PSEU|nr:DUF1295 domain-containing protein [Amycolatopsis endophytica]NYI91533.1 steroid 5-alpha reductase family enzyme [Amycolatopsis endophytica]